MNMRPDNDTYRHAVTQAKMWRNLALQCHALRDERTAAEAEAIARAYDRQAEHHAATRGAHAA